MRTKASYWRKERTRRSVERRARIYAHHQHECLEVALAGERAWHSTAYVLERRLGEAKASRDQFRWESENLRHTLTHQPQAVSELAVRVKKLERSNQEKTKRISALKQQLKKEQSHD